MWFLLLLAATVRGFAHLPLGFSDRNTVKRRNDACAVTAVMKKYLSCLPLVLATLLMLQSSVIHLEQWESIWVFAQFITRQVNSLFWCHRSRKGESLLLNITRRHGFDRCELTSWTRTNLFERLKCCRNFFLS